MLQAISGKRRLLPYDRMTNKRTMWILAAAAALVGLMIIGASAAGARSGGVSGYSGNPTTGGDTCLQCHDQDATGAAATLTGPTTVTPGSTSTYMFTVTGGPAVESGFDVSIDDGTLIASGAGTALNGGEVTHSDPQVFAGGSASWSFEWTAPASAGDYMMWGAGLSSDGSGTGGDAPTAAVSLTITVEAPPANEPPVSDPNGPYTALVGETISFDGTGSSDPDGTIVSYDWDFGDGNTGTGATPSHAYAAAAVYTVSLTVTDNEGAQDTATTTATITEAPTGDVDLDIKSFRVTKRVRLDGKMRPARITLSVRNGGLVDEPRTATVIGMMGGVEVYREPAEVSDAVGDGSSRFMFPGYVPDMSGDIVWTAIIADDDVDEDMATAQTTVVQPRNQLFKAR